ncbi:S-layer family protein, partial [Helicobacter pullorum]|uniref:S-layer family protein n=1 Tax=Helicobacter pullorum TaxID=35818 RepID=UPI000B262EA3
LVGGGGQSLNNQSLENPKNAKGLDSKSKLQSKNPNKIQTTKIQDSKIQLESNLKDLAKLESNSPKLKDSKVSKTSKDSMKLESSPKLDSKTSQKSNKESETKQAKKIQKTKNTCDSKQSKKPTKSKNSSKLKSFIRTIPISIALASALSSQAVADWTGKGIAGCTNGDGQCITGNVTMSIFDEIRSSGSATNLTISSGVTINKTVGGGSGSGKNSLIYIEEQAGTITNHGTIILNFPGVISRTFFIANTLEALNNTGYITGSNIVVAFEGNGKLGTLTNSGTIESSNVNRGTFEIANSNQIGGITLTGNGAINHNNGDVFRLSGQSQIGNITLNDNSSIRGNFNLSNSATIGTITIGGNSTGGSGNNASLTGNISLNSSSRISKILIDGSNMGGSGTNGTPKLDGDITLNTSKGITNGITIANGGTLDGNINARNSSSIGGIAINNGSLIGSISLTHTSNITGGINVQNGTITNNISAVGGARIDSINITNGRVGGDISANWGTAGNGIGTINQITITGGEVGGNIELANDNTMTNGMTLNNGTINGAINLNIGTADGSVASIPTIFLQNASTIANITLGNSATATNSQGTVVSGRGYIDSLTLGGTSHIGNIANDRGIISTLTLEGTSSIGSITNNSNGTISNIALNGTSTITNGITNASGGTISNITLASSNTIHSGITNNGIITEINHNVAGVENAVTNNTDGSISRLIVSQGTIEYNGDGAITEELSVKGGATLSMDSGNGTITMNGAVGSKLNLESGSTFKGSLKNTGSISSWSNVSNIEGSFINDTNANIGILKAGQIAGTLLNKGNIGDLTIDNVVGTLSNESEITTLSVQSEIAQGILNSGNIQTLTLENSADLGSVGVSNSGVITSLNNHKAGMQITNTQGIGTLAVYANTTYAGDNGNISQELVINQGSGQTTTFTIQGTNQTLTLGGTGNGGVKTITNEGTIIGNLINTLTTNWIGGTLEGDFTNKSNATLQSLFNGNAGTITGNLINEGSIVSLDSGTIGGSLDNRTQGIIDTLNSSVVGNLSNAGVVKDFIVDSDMDYTGNGNITNSMTILNNNTLNIGNAPSNGTINIGFDNSATGTIGNAGTINGNITNLDTSTIKNFTNESTGKIAGNIINSGIITSFTNFGSFEGNLTNKKTIGNLTTGAITGSIANSGNINTLNVTGNVTNGITNNASSTITTLTINNGASLGSGITNKGNITTLTNNQANTSITNTQNIGTLDINANTTYSGDGNITNKIDVESGDTLTIGSNGTLNFNATNGTINNAGTIKGTIDNIKGSSILDFDNSGSITGIINNGHIVEFTNNASGIIDNFVNDYTISFFENKGVIKDFSGDGIIYGVLNSKEITGDFINVATSLKNTGTITGNVQLIGNQQNCGNEICKTSDLINEGTITGTFTNTADKEMNEVKNTGVMGGISNAGNITTINTGSITGSIANSGEITALNVTGNVNNGITNDSNITNLTIDKGVNLGSGITNNAAIGNFTNNANITYSGSGSITGDFSNAKDSTITLNGDLILNGNGNAFRNDGTLKGTISNIGVLSSFTNTGSITGLESGNITGTLSNSNTGIIDNLVVNGKVSQMQNAGNIADAIIKSEIANGIINGDSNYKQATIGKLDIQASLGSNGLQNAGTITSLINNFSNTNLTNHSNIGALEVNKNLNYSGSGSITNSINIASNTTLTTSGITLNANSGSVNNEGILAGALTLAGSSNSVTNSGSITTIINNASNSSLTNNSNIGALEVNKNLNYSGSGSITNYAIIAENTTLNNSTALIFASNNQGLENKGIITGSLENKGNMQLLSNSGTTSQINGDITNSGLITNLANQGTISGDITNDAGSTITSFINSGTITGNLYNDGHIDTLHNKGTMGTIYNTSKNTIENLFNDKNSVIAGIDNSKGRYDLIQNQGTILGNINNNNGTITKLENANNGTITGQIISNGNSNIGTIINAGVINSSHTMNDSDIQNASNDAISLDTISNVVTAISNSGSINGNVRVAGNSEVNVIENSKVIAGCIILEGGRIGKINNTNGAIANCMSFSSGASVGGLNNDGTISGTITNDSGSITVNNGGSGSIGGITTSGGGNTTIINGGKDIMKGGHIGTISNKDNSNTHIDGWTLDNPDNPSNPIIIADGSNKDGIHLKEDSIFVEGNLESGKIYDYYGYIKDENGNSIGQDFSQDDELFDALTFIDILKPTDNGDGTYSLGLDTRELSGKTLGASLIYSSRMRQIDTNSMLREINVKNFKTDFEILEQRERLKNQQALLENYKQQRESYLNGLTKDNKELKRVSSKESTSLSTYANNSNIKSDAIEVVDYYNKDALASLDNLQATTKANQETYSNLDLLRELDDIFISHTGDKDNLYTFALPYTRYTSAQLDGGVGTLKSHASGILAGAQAKLPSERGILGIYFGYESSDKQVGQQR